MNIVLIGMPSAGKTTLGKMLAKRINKSFIDLDDLVVHEAGMSIPEIFMLEQEEGFRKRETDAVRYAAGLHDVVISTGGGVIKNKINIDLLKETGTIIFINRHLDKLANNDDSRPLSSSKEAVEKMFIERYPLYKHYSDITVENNGPINNTVNNIIEVIEKEAK